MKIAILFDNLGPYHKARLRAVSERCELLAVEFGTVSGDYAWKNEAITGMRHAVCNPHGPSRALDLPTFRLRLGEILDGFAPDVVAVPGWGKRGAFLAFEWCVENRCPAIVMSESTAWDEPRVAWKESIKRRVVGLASAALVGGSPHQEYIQQLDMPRDRVFLGYDTVDNDHFSSKAQDAREEGEREGSGIRGQEADQGLRTKDAAQRQDQRPGTSSPLLTAHCSLGTSPYFLASNRFIAKKNLFRMLEAYSEYGRDGLPGRPTLPGPENTDGHRPPLQPWPLVLLGDGNLKPALIAKCQELGLTVQESAPWESSGPARRSSPTVFMPGFRQIGELPRFYAHAGAFVHASTTEQWGLVVNEAMACGLPVMVSNRVGCARDLVAEGRNGFTFDPLDVAQLAGLLERMAAMPEQERAGMGETGREIIGHWGPERFASGLMAAAQKAIETGPKRAGLIDRILLRALAAR